MIDHKAKGAADFAARNKNHELFHDAGNAGRLYREGWHAARRAAEDDDRLAGFEHAGQRPVEPFPPAHVLSGLTDRSGTPQTPAPRAEELTAEAPANRAGDICDACNRNQPGHVGRNVDCAPAVGLWICDDCAKEADEARARYEAKQQAPGQLSLFDLPPSRTIVQDLPRSQRTNA